jgi:hypothetical protein
MPRYFTIDEVNPFVPRLTQLFTQVMQLRTRLKPLYRELEARGFAPVGDDFDPVVRRAPADVVRDRHTFRGLLDVLKETVAEIQACGCQIKDLETGLVDWYAEAPGREVLLCWKFGEKEVAFFHELDAGFPGRRPIAELPATP